MADQLKVAVLFQRADLLATESGATQRVLLMPDGLTRFRDGDEILVDAQASADVISAFEEHGVDIPFDINHSTHIKLPKGEPAPAVGWGKRLSYEPGRGIFCEVDWNDEGRRAIRAKEYRYLSAVTGYDRSSKRAKMISSVGLTTRPATPNMPALAASEVFGFLATNKKESGMPELIKALQEAGESTVATAEQKMGELKALLEGKGVALGDGADFVAILNAAISALSGGGEDKPEEDKPDGEVAASVRQVLGLARDAGKEVVVKALSELKGHLGYVPAAQHNQVVERLSALETAENQRASSDLMTKALSEGKLNAADEKQMAWAKELSAKDPATFKACMDAAPVVIPQGQTKAPSQSPTRPGGVDEEKLIEKALSEHDGNTVAAYSSLQIELMKPHLDAGFTKAAARQRCLETHPKIFA